MQTVKRTIAIAAGVGFTVAICLGLLWQFANRGDGHHAALEYTTTCLWPTSLMLMANENSGPALNALLLFLSAATNGALYAVLMLLAVSGWKALRRTRAS